MNVLANLESSLETLAGSPWTYLLVFAIAAVDVLFPVVPSEATVMLGGVMAATGDLQLLPLILAAAAGAIAGDNLAYGLGRSLGPTAARRLAGGPKGQKMLAWAERQIAQRGGTLIISSRFIPGGRTAATLTAGIVAMPWRRFLAFDLGAGAFWASYCALVGFLGGRAFSEDPLIAILVAIAFTIAVSSTIELIRARRTPQPA